MPKDFSQLRIIVSNTGPFISLEKLPGGFDMMRKLYGKIIIPTQVLEELSQGMEPELDYLYKYNIQDFVAVEEVELPHETSYKNLDAGERYAIALALKKGTALLIEERAGRRIARMEGVKISGAAGQIKKAFQNGVLNQNEAIKKLRALLQNRRISNKVYTALKKEIS